MSYIEVVIISIALGLDAFGVAVSLGLDRRINVRKALIFVFSFSFFQFLLVFSGGIGGNLFNKYIFTLPSVIGGIIILLVGILMVKDAFSEEKLVTKINWFVYIFLGLCVSVDAFVVGFSSFNELDDVFLLFDNSVIVGIITALLTILAFAISKKIRGMKFIKEYSDLLGGIILILFGIKMILFG